MGTKKKRIQVYVNDATYGQIEGYAQNHGVSISEAAGQLLSTQVVNAPLASSQYVTKAQMTKALEQLEVRYQAYSEAMLAQQLAWFKTAVDFNDRLSEEEK